MSHEDGRAHVVDADPWFVNLEDVARRVEANEQAERTARVRIITIAVFVLFAFLALGFRQQVNISRIAETQRIELENRYLACVSQDRIIVQYNEVLEELARATVADPKADPATRDRKVQAYMAGLIPRPTCEPLP